MWRKKKKSEAEFTASVLEEDVCEKYENVGVFFIISLFLTTLIFILYLMNCFEEK